MTRRRITHIAGIALLFLAAAGLTGAVGSPAKAPSEEAAVTAPAPASGEATPTVCLADPLTVLPQPEDDVTPVACRMAPQCSADSDCIAWCGPNGGKCVHSSCPIRICKCH